MHVISSEKHQGLGKDASPMAGDAKCCVSLYICISRGHFKVALSNYDVKKIEVMKVNIWNLV